MRGKAGKGGLARQMGAGLMAALLGITAMGAMPTLALADQTGTGETSLVLRLKDGAERGGTAATGEYANPDTTGNGLGDNLAFTVPTRIDFVAAPDGTLTGPDPSVAYIENESAYGVHVSSLEVRAKNGWNVVEDAARATDGNDVDVSVGPVADVLNAADYLVKANVANPNRWTMASRTAEGVGDRVQLAFSGHINNVSFDITKDMTFGQVNWYVTPGTVA